MSNPTRLTADLLNIAKGDAAFDPIEDTGPGPGRKTLVLRVDPDLHERLRERAFRRRTTMQDIVLTALARHLDG